MCTIVIIFILLYYAFSQDSLPMVGFLSTEIHIPHDNIEPMYCNTCVCELFYIAKKYTHIQASEYYTSLICMFHYLLANQHSFADHLLTFLDASLL